MRSGGLRDLEPRVWVRELSVAALFVALAVVMTWPLARLIDRAVMGPGDPYVSAWVLHWDYVATFSQPLNLFDAPIFHPARLALAFSEHMYGIALFFFPLFAFGVSPVTVHNIAVIVGFAFSGYGMYLLARTLTQSTGPSIVAGIIFAFIPFRFNHIVHLSYLWSGWIPVSFATLFAYLRRPSQRAAAWFGLALLFNGLSCLHWFVFTVAGVAATGAVALTLLPHLRSLRQWTALLIATAVALTLLLPFLVPYATVGELYGMKRTYRETVDHSATFSDWLYPGTYIKVWGQRTEPLSANSERWLFPGVLPIVMAVIGVLYFRPGAQSPAPLPRRSRHLRHLLDVAIATFVIVAWFVTAGGTVRLGGVRLPDASLPLMAVVVLSFVRYANAASRAAIQAGQHVQDTEAVPVQQRFIFVTSLVLLAVGFIGSLGTNAFFHRFLFDYVSPFRSIRAPVRWAILAYLALALLGGFGALSITRNWRRPIVPALLCLLLLLELRSAPLRYFVRRGGDEPVYGWLAGTSLNGAIIEIPFGVPADEYAYMLGNTEHGQRTFNGLSSFLPPSYAHLYSGLHRPEIGSGVLEELERNACSLVVVHAHRLGTRSAAIRQWLSLEIRRGRLKFLGRFAHDVDGDFVFATSLEPPVPLRRSIVAAGGRSDARDLSRFLAGESTYNAATFGVTDFPRPFATVLGPLDVRGWALSPFGIRAVNVTFQNGAVTHQATVGADPELHRLFPGYSNVPAPRFSLHLTERPPGVTRETDVQVEIVDGAGRVTRLTNIHFDWRPERTPLTVDSWREDALAQFIARYGLDPADVIPKLKSGDVQFSHLFMRIEGVTEGQSDAAFLNHAYAVLLARAPDQTGTNKFLDRLARGGKRRDVIKTLVMSNEFRERHLEPGAAFHYD